MSSSSSPPSCPSAYLARSSSSSSSCCNIYTKGDSHDADDDQTCSSPRNDCIATGSSLVADLHSHLEDKEISDIELVGTDGKSVVAVRSILAMRSRFFKKMLFGSFCESKSNRISLGYSSLVLRAVVEYCYTDELNTAFENLSFEETARSMVGLVAAGNYFELGGLQSRAYRLTCLMMDEYPALACAVLDESLEHPNQEGELSRVALGIIRLRTESSLLPPDTYLGVQSLGPAAMEKVMADDKIQTNELALFTCLKRWADHSSERHVAACRMCERIDFAEIRPSDLCTVVAESGIVPTHLLTAAYRTQALQAERQGMVFGQPRTVSTNNNTFGKIIVQGAGLQAVNGTYTVAKSLRCGIRYTKQGGRLPIGPGEFYLHTCTMQDDTKKWFLSFRCNSGKSLDLYSAPLLSDEALDPPPMQKWLAVVASHMQLRSLQQNDKDKKTAAIDGMVGDPPPICIWLPDEQE